MKLNCKTHSLSWLRLVVPVSLLPLVSGCSVVDHSLGVPTPLPVPTPVPTPGKIIFNPGDASPRGTALNGNDPGQPTSFAVSEPDGNMVTLHSVSAGVENPVGDRVHLAGIVAPDNSTDLGKNVVKAINDWTAGTNNDADIDPKFPTDVNGVRLVVIYFHGHNGSATDTPPTGAKPTAAAKGAGAKGTPMPLTTGGTGPLYCLNRMLVRSGLAVVDLYSPTSFTTKDWLLDESYARINHLGFWPNPDVFLKLQQRPSNLILNHSNAVGTATGAPGGPAAAGKPGSKPVAPAPMAKGAATPASSPGPNPAH